MTEECGICYEEFTVAATTNCLHTVCYICFLRNRVLCGRKACLLCSDVIKNAIIYKKGSLSLDAIQKQLRHDHRYKAFEARYISRYHAIVTADVMSEVNLLDLPPCPICSHHPTNKHDLQEHVRKEHEVEYCRVCIANKPSFMSDQLTYDRDALRKHMTHHPLCPLCKRPQYDNDSYKDHLLTEHHRCEICREHGVSDSYWRTADDLIEHHHSDHYVCTAPACKTVMVAFGTKDELLAHQVSTHPELFTQKELEDTQMRLFCGVKPDTSSNLTRQRKPKRRDVTNLISLTRFSLNNRIQNGEVDCRKRPNSYANTYNSHTSTIAEDAIFEMHTKLAIKNSLETARLESLMREPDTDQTISLADPQLALNPASESTQSIYDPAIELIERHKEQLSTISDLEPSRLPVLVAPMALPGPEYKQKQAGIHDSTPPTATQATLDRFLNKKKDAQNSSSSVSTIFDTNTPTPLSRAELLQRTHERLGIVYKPAKKKKVRPADTVEESLFTDGKDAGHSDDPVQVQDFGLFYGAPTHLGTQKVVPEIANKEQQQQQRQQQQQQPIDSGTVRFPVDTSTSAKTSVQASLELYQRAATSNTSDSNTQPRIDQICGIPVIYKKKKKSQS